MNPLKILFFILIISPIISSAYEVDNFSQRYNPLPDSNSVLSQAMNEQLKLAVETLNSQNKTKCVKSDIINAVKKEIAPDTATNFVGPIEKIAEKDSRIQRHTPLKNSIYSNKSFAEKIKKLIPTFYGEHSSINLNGQYIGTDKLGHFIYEGYSYYNVYKNDPTKSGLNQVLNNGLKSENNYYGKKSTGIISYGDLAANYEGLLFWKDIYNEKKSENSYFSCWNGQWKQTRNFNWSDYASSAWDEAINCSKYDEDTEIKKHVESKLKALTDSHKNRKIKNIVFACPMSVGECMRLKTKYGKIKDSILGPDCINAYISSPHNDIHSAQKADEVLKVNSNGVEKLLNKNKSSN